MQLPLLTPRLVIRDLVFEDIPHLIETATHPDFSGYRQFRPTHVSEDVKKYIEKAIEFQKPDASSKTREIYRLAICLKEDRQQPIGCCVFHGWTQVSKDNDQIGYFLHPLHQRKGYMRESVQFLLSEYFLRFPERAVYATAHPSNVTSIKVLEKLGFSRFGTKTIEVNGIEEPRIIYSVEAQNLNQSFISKESRQSERILPLTSTGNSLEISMTQNQLDEKAR